MVITTELYWDCECDKNYIHHKKTEGKCSACQTFHDNQPDSRENEVAGQLLVEAVKALGSVQLLNYIFEYDGRFFTDSQQLMSAINAFLDEDRA